MFERVVSFIDGMIGGGARFEEDDYRLAAAALLVHVTSADGAVVPAERAQLERALTSGFALDPSDTRRLLEAALDASQAAMNLSTFTDVLRAKLDETARARVVAMMWDLVHADGQAHEIEEAVVDRAAELLGVSRRASP